MTKIEELEKKRADVLAARAKAEEAQYEKDLEARFALEDEHGPCAEIKMPVYKGGQPTRAYVRTPAPAEYRRFKDIVQRNEKNASKQAEAGEQLARSAWVYPAGDEAKASMLDAYPGLLTIITVAAAELAQGARVDEGKG